MLRQRQQQCAWARAGCCLCWCMLRRLTLPSAAMLAKKQQSRGTLEPALAAASAVAPSVMLRMKACDGRRRRRWCSEASRTHARKHTVRTCCGLWLALPVRAHLRARACAVCADGKHLASPVHLQSRQPHDVAHAAGVRKLDRRHEPDAAAMRLCSAGGMRWSACSTALRQRAGLRG